MPRGADRCDTCQQAFDEHTYTESERKLDRVRKWRAEDDGQHERLAYRKPGREKAQALEVWAMTVPAGPEREAVRAEARFYRNRANGKKHKV